MKLALKFSLLGNVVLLITLSLLMARRINTTSPRAVFTAPASTMSYFPAVRSPAAPVGFSWKQIESTDYRAYLANLRAIGCPEETVQDIIRADVHGLYAKKRAELGLDERNHSGPWSVTEETRVVASLLGSDLEQGLSPASAASGTPVLPLVLRDLDPEALQLDKDQQAALAELRSEFVAAIGATNLDVTDPAYAKRWQQAQPESDRLLRGMIGVNAFMRYQNEAQ
jgi:hypothetical protein